MRSTRRETSTSGSSTRRRRAASSTGSTATRCRPCCGRRSCAASPPAACSRLRRGSSSSGRSSACASWSPRTGTSSARSTPAPSKRVSSPSTARASRRARTSAARASRTDPSSSSTRSRRRRSRGISTAGRSRSPPSRRSRTAAAPPRRSARPRSSRRRAGSCATRRRRRCGSPSGSTRTATSRTCGRTRSRCPRRPCAPPGHTPSERTARRPFPTRLAATSGPSRTRRRRTRRSAPRATSSARRRRSPARSRATSSPLYELIFKRTVASQMKDATGQTVSIQLEGATAAGTTATFGASGTVITFPGFLLAYESGTDEPAEEDEERRLPPLTVGQPLEATELRPDGHETRPPARYTEASLVKALEDRGIGRPSTYAAIMGTILDRGYVFKKGTALVPTFTAFAVTQLLEQHYGSLVDYEFTARMEDDLDRIAAGDEERVAWLTRFYKGDGGEPGLRQLVTDHLERDRRTRGQLDLDPGLGHRRPRRTIRAVSRARGRARVAARRHRPGRADSRESRGAARAVLERARARCRSRDRERDRRAQRPLRALRGRGAAGRLGGEAADGVALRVDGSRRRSPSRRRCGCSRCRGRWASIPRTARRSWP